MPPWPALIVAALVSACAATPPPGEGLAAARADALLSALHARGEFDGAAVIMRDGEVAYARGFGFANAEARARFAPDTPVDGASLAKPVVAAAVLLLAEQGRVDLDAPARRYVSEFPHPETTLRQLLSHSAGLPDYDAFERLLDAGPVTTSELLRASAGRGAPLVDPASPFAYCNLCYDTLALVVERVSGRSFESFARERLLAPAGAGGVFVRPARLAEYDGVRTRGYRRAGGRLEANDALDNEGFYGGGNLYFSARDLAAWTAAWLDTDILPAPVRAAALLPARAGRRPTVMTLGNWYCDAPRRRCWYPGHHQGFHNFGYWDQDRRLSVAFVSNNTLAGPLQPGLARALVAIAEGREAEGLPVIASPTPKLARSAAVGTYGAGARQPVVVAAEGERLMVRMAEGPAYPLYPVASGMLYAPGLDAWLSFSDLQAGAYSALRLITVLEDARLRRIAG